jgi:copper(I)-binding protein
MISRRTLGVAVIAVLPLVAACGAGRNTTTDKERQTPYVSGASAGSLLVTAVSLVPAQTSGSASASPSAGTTSSAATASTPTPTPSPSSPDTSSGGSIGSVADAYLVASIVNRGSTPDQLIGVLVEGATVAPVDASSKGLTVPPSQAVTFGDPELGGSGNALQVNGLTQPLALGTAVPVTFRFRQAGSVTLQVQVRDADGYGTTATSSPVPLTGSYPSASEAELPPTGG